MTVVGPRTGTPLLDAAEGLYDSLPGHRVEIVGGRLVVTPPPDSGHARSLTRLTFALAPFQGHGTEVVQGVGLWLPTGEEDYAVPDLAVVGVGFGKHVVAFNCCEPEVFRMVVEITSSNRITDLTAKPQSYAAAGVPVYVVGDRRRREVVVFADPRGGEYRSRAVYPSGETFVVPEVVRAGSGFPADPGNRGSDGPGRPVELDVDDFLIIE
ncbi:Uma2 family endonuclease [Streptomyces sp. ST2-7A]|nr:Uma2 family endonuclease [Streptomyces sp. ST2-7A]